ncbi:hypothetical protein GGS21DRAFT_530811 [Xylaria nigripes]|nr:hypothetical protein GGS21DRAFT_530811 [Xylaria nigripes]
MPSRFKCCAHSSAGRVLQRTITNPTRIPIVITQNVTRMTRVASRQYATAGPLTSLKLPDDYVPPTQPPSARRPELRKTQLLRSYTSTLRSTPLMLFFQHNNLTAVEWAAVRRELRAVLEAVPPPPSGPDGTPIDINSNIELAVLRTRIFSVACRIVEYYKPHNEETEKTNKYMHDLSEAAYETIVNAAVDESSTYGQIQPLIVGPVAAVNVPSVSPAHLEAVLKVLAPSPAFPAPTRKKSPGFYDSIAQSGFQKLILLGGRIENRAFDNEGVKWVGGIEGGLDALRAQMMALLHQAGLSITTVLEGHGKGLWLALEGRRTQLEEEANGGKKESQDGNESNASNA